MSHFAVLSGLMGMSHVIVVGAGYAGVTAANRLARDHRVTVVNERPEFVERVRLHQLVAGSAHSVTRPLARMLARGVDLVVDTVVSVDDGVARTVSGVELTGDQVVLAVGSGAREGVTTYEGALELRRALDDLPSGAVVRVLGAGLTGVEVATEVAESRPSLSVQLVDPAGVLPGLGEEHRAPVASALERLGVAMATDEDALPPATVEVDCTGLAVPALARNAGEVDHLGRAPVAPDFSVPGRPGLWAVGDCARVDGQPWLRMSCAAAMPLGAQVATSIRRAERGLAPGPVSFGFAAQCVSLGRRDALLLGVDRQDAPTSRIVTGRPAVVVKEALCRWSATAPRLSRGRYWPEGVV